jgi:DNA gyrase/topoisomerase IV subunit B
MKIKKSQLREIIREELQAVLSEKGEYAGVLHGKKLHTARAEHRARIKRLKTRIASEKDSEKKKDLQGKLKNAQGALDAIS